MTVRLQQLTPPFSSDHHQLITKQLLPLHRQLRSNLAETSPDAYLTLMQTVCTLSHAQLLLAFAPSASASSPSASDEADADDDTLIGFASFRSMQDTFNTHRVNIDDLVVDAAHRGQGTGTTLLRYIRQHAVDVDALYITMEVETDRLRCQRLFYRSDFRIEAFFFTCSAPAVTAQPASLNERVQTTLIDSSNFSSAECQHLLRLLEPAYRNLRPSPQQLPLTTAAYIERLHRVLSAGAFSLVAHSADCQQVWGVATCRRIATVKEGDRVHVDDLVVAESERSTGVGRVLMEAVKSEASKGDSSSPPDAAPGSRRCVVTLESGTQRVRAHAFYVREHLLITDHFWRIKLPQPQQPQQ